MPTPPSQCSPTSFVAFWIPERNTARRLITRASCTSAGHSIASARGLPDPPRRDSRGDPERLGANLGRRRPARRESARLSHKLPATNAELMSRDVEPLPTTPAMKFQDAARLALGDHQLRHNMGVATHAIREKRAKVVGRIARLGVASRGRSGHQGSDPAAPRILSSATRSRRPPRRRRRALGARRRRGQRADHQNCHGPRGEGGGQDQIADHRRDRSRTRRWAE